MKKQYSTPLMECVSAVCEEQPLLAGSATLGIDYSDTLDQGDALAGEFYID